jgi:hypothetical protein
VHESGIITTQMGTHNRSEMVTVLGMPCAIPPRNSKLLYFVGGTGLLSGVDEDAQQIRK